MSLEDQLDYIPFFRYYVDNLFTSTQAGNRISSLSNNNATNSIITNNNQLYDSSSTCDTGKLCFSSNFCLTEVSLLPTCLLALLIGCYTSNKIQAKYKFKGSWLYSLTFFLFGIMMTDALIVHCLVPRPDTKNSKWFLISFLVGIIDVGLTSNIGVAFAFCGLSDLKWIDSNSIQTKIGLFSSFTLVFMSWYFALVNQWKNSFIILYAGIVAVGCGIYLLTQIILLSRNVKNQNESDVLGILYFVLGGLSGFIGLGAVFWWSTSICNFLGPYYNPYLGPRFVFILLFINYFVKFYLVYFE